MKAAMMIAAMLIACPETAQAFDNLPKQLPPPTGKDLAETMRKIEAAKAK